MNLIYTWTNNQAFPKLTQLVHLHTLGDFLSLLRTHWQVHQTNEYLLWLKSSPGSFPCQSPKDCEYSVMWTHLRHLHHLSRHWCCHAAKVAVGISVIHLSMPCKSKLCTTNVFLRPLQSWMRSKIVLAASIHSSSSFSICAVRSSWLAACQTASIWGWKILNAGILNMIISR